MSERIQEENHVGRPEKCVTVFDDGNVSDIIQRSEGTCHRRRGVGSDRLETDRLIKLLLLLLR